MNRRVPLVLLVVLATTAGLVVLRRVHQRERRTRARAEMMEAKMAIGVYSTLGSLFRQHPEDLRRPLTQADVDAIEIGADTWGHDYIVEVDWRHAVTITCLGADGVSGGEGADEDIVVRWPSSEGPAPR